jgi:hypothetical protein
MKIAIERDRGFDPGLYSMDVLDADGYLIVENYRSHGDASTIEAGGAASHCAARALTGPG